MPEIPIAAENFTLDRGMLSNALASCKASSLEKQMLRCQVPGCFGAAERGLIGSVTVISCGTDLLELHKFSL